jgi:hypothetical protein
VTRRRRTPMVAITSFAHAGRTIRDGDELAGKDPVVASHAPYFAPSGTPRSEWPRPLVALPRREEPAPPPPVMVGIRSFAVPGGHAIVMVARGDRFTATHELVRLFPDRFAPEETA